MANLSLCLKKNYQIFVQINLSFYNYVNKIVEQFQLFE